MDDWISVIFSVSEESIQNIILIGGDNQLDGKTEFTGVKPRQYITKVARRYRERYMRNSFFLHLKVRIHVIHNLSQNPSPMSRSPRRHLMFPRMKLLQMPEVHRLRPTRRWSWIATSNRIQRVTPQSALEEMRCLPKVLNILVPT